jgi:PAS domain S-box-containing protein
MHQHLADPATEVKRLQSCVNNLVSILALPAVWSVSEPRRILDTFLDALLAMLDLDFLYARVRLDSNQAPIDALRAAPLYGTKQGREEIRQALNRWSGEVPQNWSNQVFGHPGAQQVSVLPIRMGIEGDLGLIVAGSQRAGFPEQTESLVLNVAANQLAIGLQQALLLREQKRVASELDRRVAERTRELAETNRELQLQVGLLQHLPVSAWTLRPDGTPDYVNGVWLEFSGQTLDFVRSHPEAWMTAVHPDDRETASKAFWDGVRSGKGFAVETRSLRAQDGTYRWHLQQATVLHDAEGKVLKFVGTTTDIDDQKRAEDALRAREANLRQILDGIPGFVCTLIPPGQVELPNQRLLEYFGKTLEEVNSWLTNDLVHPDDLPRVTAEVTHSFTTGTPYDSELRYRRADGVYRWFQVRIHPVRDTEGRVARWYGLIADIDDRKRAEDEFKRSEASYRVVIETASDAVVSIDESGAIILANSATKRIFGYNPEELIGKPLTVLMPGAMRKFHEAGFKRYLGTGTKRLNWQGTEMTALRANGEEFPVEVSFGEMTADQRKVFTGFIRDISEKKRAEEALRNTQAELARMMRIMTIGQLTASIAHEVSQPLQGIITNAGTCLRMLKSDPPNIDGAQETAQRTIRDGNRASDVITRLRTLYSKKQIDVGPLDLNEATREVVALLSGELERNNVILKQEFSDRLPTIHGDRVQLQQVILNLLRNASDAMSSVEDRPRQMVLRTELEGEQVRLSVQDSGVGFTPEVAGQMFESFYTTKSDGMGVGLSVSRSIIEANRGRLWATANDGPGATFAFSIPCEHGSHPQERPGDVP